MPCLALAAGAVAGLLLAHGEVLGLRTALAGFALTTGAGLLTRGAGRPRHVLLPIALSLFFFAAWHGLRIGASPSRMLAESLAPHLPMVATATGVVVSDPRIHRPPDPLDPVTATFLIKTEGVTTDTLSSATPAHLLIVWRGTPPAFGDRVQATGTLDRVPPARNPGAYDQAKTLARADCHLRLRVDAPWDARLLATNAANPLRMATHHARGWILRALTRDIEDSPDAAGVVTGIVLGARESQSPDLREDFRVTGTMHLFAVSGLHVWMFGLLAWLVISMFQPERRRAILILLPLLVAYAAVTGFRPPVTRATIMAAVVLGTLIIERPASMPNSLAAAALLILLVDPGQLITPGFQLSFCVVSAIALLAPRLTRWLGDWWVPDPFIPARLLTPVERGWQSAGRAVTSAIGVTTAAWLGSLPLVLWHFHLISPVGLLANLPAVLLGFAVLAVGLISLTLTPLAPPLAILANNSNWLLATILLGLVRAAADLPGGHIHASLPAWPSPPETRVVIHDFGEGAGTAIRTPDTTWLLDAGPQAEAKHFLTRSLRAAGVRRIHGIVITHGDSTHIGGVTTLLDSFPVHSLHQPWSSDRSTTRRRILRAARGRDLPVQTLATGDRLPLGDSTHLDILHPPRSAHGRRRADDECLVARLDAFGHTVLFLGDSGFSSFHTLRAAGPDRARSLIVVAGWNAADPVGLEEFLIHTVRPALVILGPNPFARDPMAADRVADTLRSHGIQVMNQRDTGAVILTLSPDNATARPWLANDRSHAWSLAPTPPP